MNNTFKKLDFTRETKRRTGKSRKALGIAFAAIMLISVFTAVIPTAGVPEITVDGDRSDWSPYQHMTDYTRWEHDDINQTQYPPDGYVINNSTGMGFWGYYDVTKDTLYFRLNIINDDPGNDTNINNNASRVDGGEQYTIWIDRDGNVTTSWINQGSADADFKIRYSIDGVRLRYLPNQTLVTTVSPNGSIDKSSTGGSGADVTNPIVEMSVDNVSKWLGGSPDNASFQASAGSNDDPIPEDWTEWVQLNSPNLTITKSAPSDTCLCLNSNITYNITYCNTGNTNATGVYINDTLPDNTTFVSATDEGTYNSTTKNITWNIDTVVNGTCNSVYLTVNVNDTVGVGTWINNTAWIYSNETLPTDASSATQVYICPTACFVPTATNCSLNASFNASCSSDPDGNIVNWTWTYTNTTNPTPVLMGYEEPLNGVGYYVFSIGDTYNVTLEVTDNDGCNATYSENVTVGQNPVACFVPNATNCSLNASFNGSCSYDMDVNGFIANWTWSYTNTTQTDPVVLMGYGEQLDNYAFPIGDTYNVTLKVTDNGGCENTTWQNVTVGQTPVACFTNNATNCSLVASFNGSCSYDIDVNGSITNWTWSYTNTSQPTISVLMGYDEELNNYAFPVGDTYNVTLKVTDKDGCENTTWQDVLVGQPPVACFVPNATNCSLVASFNGSCSYDIDVNGNITNWTWSYTNTTQTDPVV
ncbi:MAG TPA: hypothetical protein VMW67_01475, partial [Desulfobacteria bacterium]|nr:hypothetical protein [Desulfobacteria bacterium]